MLTYPVGIEVLNLILKFIYFIKDLRHFDRVSAYFSDASQNFPMYITGILLNRTSEVLGTN